MGEDNYESEMKKVVTQYHDAIENLRKIQLEILKDAVDKKEAEEKIAKVESKEFEVILHQKDEDGKQLYSNETKRVNALNTRLNELKEIDLEFRSWNTIKDSLETSAKLKSIEVEYLKNKIVFYNRILSLSGIGFENN